MVPNPQYEISKPILKIGFMSTHLSQEALAHESSMAWKEAAIEVFTKTCKKVALDYWLIGLSSSQFPIDPMTGDSDPAQVVQWLRNEALSASETPVSSFDSPAGKCCAYDDFGKWERTRHYALTKVGNPWNCQEILDIYVSANNLVLPVEVAAELAALPVMGFLSWVVGPT